MSTKTTIKRIALVAVSALGLGVVTAIAPASAGTAIVTGSMSLSQVTTARTGAPVIFKYGFNYTKDGSLSNADTVTIAAKFASALPAANTSQDLDNILMLGFNGNDVVANTADLTSLFYRPTSVDTTTGKNGVGDAGDVDATNANDATANNAVWNFNDIDATVTSADDATTSNTGYFSFTPAAAGAYSIQIWNDEDSSGTINGSEVSKTISFTVATETIKSITVTTFGTAATTGSDLTGGTDTLASGGLAKVTLTGSDGLPALPTTSENLVVAATGSAYFTLLNDGSSADNPFVYQSDLENVGETFSGDPQTINVNYWSFDHTGSVYLNIKDATAETSAITATLGAISGSGSQAFSTGGATQDTDGLVVSDEATGIYTATNSSAPNYTFPSGVASSFTFYVAAGSAAKVAVEIIDNQGFITGLPGADMSRVVTTGTTANLGTAADDPAAFSSTSAYMGSLTLSLTASIIPNSGATFTLQGEDTTDQTVTAALITSRAYDFADTVPGATFNAVKGSTLKLETVLYDGFGVEAANKAVTVGVTGRNATAANVNKVTDADGLVDYTITDSGTTGTTSTVTFTYNTTVTEIITITWVDSITATTMTTSPSATTTAANNPSDLGGVNTATATASTGRDSVTATLKDANGVAMPGVPVTLTVPAGVSLYTGSTAVEYTDSTGVATWDVYTTKAGTYEFTFTGGGLTKTGYGKWTGSNGRVVKVTAGTTTGDITPVTIRVEDAYGNGVPSVALTVKGSGAGYFQGMPLSSSQTTNADGEIIATWVGNGTVTASGTSAHMFYGAGLVGTTAAAGFPAGVSTASATVDGANNSSSDAVDAANDAVEAANAATDAANAAAEAADAATAAAQDAQAAVADLAAQVATLISGIKAQITRLTNLVIKIQKKVNA